MPRSLAWVLVVDNVPPDEAAAFLETSKPYRVENCNIVACMTCTSPEPHTMEHRLLSCSSPACKTTCQYDKCQWRGRVLECTNMRESAIYEYGDHSSVLSDRIDQKHIKLTEAHKVYLREMAAQGLRPSRIRNSIPRKFGVDMETLPSLSKVQNFVNHYRKKMLMNNDKRKDITEFIHEHEFSGHENDTTPFTFGWTRDEYGNMFVGNGSDEKPFVVGMTTKRLLFRMDRPSNSFILHLDATFKLNQVDYPVVVCGISDRCRSFHLVALYISSQRTEYQYVECLLALRNVYARVTGKSLVVSTVMGDADKAQFNAITIVFGPDNNYIYLMCFYHLVAKIVERTKGMSEAAKDRVFRDIYNIPFSRTMLACVELVQVSTAAWRSDPETKEFAEYFVTQWLQGEFVRWQCFHTAGAFATTNNPVEQFNKKLKRDYTLRQRLKMGTLMQHLLSCCHNESSSERGVRLQVEPSSTLKRRTKELVKLKLLGQVIPPSAVVEAVNSNIKFEASSRHHVYLWLRGAKLKME